MQAARLSLGLGLIAHLERCGETCSSVPSAFPRDLCHVVGGNEWNARRSIRQGSGMVGGESYTAHRFILRSAGTGPALLPIIHTSMINLTPVDEAHNTILAGDHGGSGKSTMHFFLH